MLSVGSALLGAALQERIGKHQGKKYTKLWRTKDVLSPIPSTPSKKPLPVTTPHGRALFHSFKNTNGIFFPVQKRCQQKDVTLLPDGAGAVQGPTANTLSSTTHSCSALGASTEALTIGLNSLPPCSSSCCQASLQQRNHLPAWRVPCCSEAVGMQGAAAAVCCAHSEQSSGQVTPSPTAQPHGVPVPAPCLQLFLISFNNLQMPRSQGD